MKTSIKRFSKCSMSVVLAVMMLVTSLTVGMVNFNAVSLSDSDTSAVSAASENDAVGASTDNGAVAANAGDSVGGTATTIYFSPSSDTVTSGYCDSTGTLNSGYTLKANYNEKGDGSQWNSTTMTLDGGTYNGKAVYKASFTDSYDGLGELQFQIYEGSTWKTQSRPITSWTVVSTYNGKLYNGSAWVDYTGSDPDPTANEYNAVASDDIKNNDNLYTITTTLYDYYTDNEVTNGWRSYSQIDANKGTSYESHGKNDSGQADPYTKLNTALANYAKTNNVKYPLYFGVLYNYGTDGNTEFTDTFGGYFFNFNNWVNNASGLSGGLNSSVIGLTGRTLTQADEDKMLRYYNDNSTTETDDGAIVPLFDKDWLFDNNLATVVNAEFPMRKTTSSNGTTYYEFNSASQDNVWLSRNSDGSLAKDSSGNFIVNYGTDVNDRVYDANATYGGNVNGAGFFPFDASMQNGGTTKNNANDYGFGMRTDIEFNVGKNGLINGEAQKFNFTGDDDLWVYIDGKLVLDLGGAHKQAVGSIDFSTKTVNLSTNTDSVNSATRNTSFEFDNSDPSKTHTLTMFYMERGMIESNLKFGFNFSPIGNQFTTQNTVDTTNVNVGLQDAVAKADEFTYTQTDEGTAASDKVYTYSKDGNTYTTDSEGKYKVNSAERASFTDQFTVGNTFNVKQTDTGHLQYTTGWVVQDNITGDAIKRASGVDSKDTGDFTFKTTDTAKQFAKTDILLQYTNTPKVSGIDITKVVQNAAGNVVTKDDDSTEFGATVTVDLGDGRGYNAYALAYTVDGDNSVYTLNSDGTLADGAKLQAGKTLHFTGLPVGANVKVVEDTVAKYETTVKVNDGETTAQSYAEVAVASDVTNKVEFTNKQLPQTPVKVQHMLHSNSATASAQKLLTTIVVYQNSVEKEKICTDADTSSNAATIPANYIVKGAGYTFKVTLTTIPSYNYKFEDFYDNSEDTILGNGDFTDFTEYTKGLRTTTATTITVNVDDLFGADGEVEKSLLKFYSLLSTDVNYKIDYKFNTRLYGEKIYTVSGKMSDNEITTYFGSVVPTALNNSFVQSKIPYESNFMKNLIWDGEATDIKTIDTNTLYAKLNSSQTDRTVSAKIYYSEDGSPVSVNGVPYGGHFTVNEAKTAYEQDGDYLQVVKPDGKYFSYWAIYKAADFTGDKDDIMVAKCYSEYFNYVGYDDYVVKAVFTDDASQKNTEIYVTDAENLCTAVYLQTTRNHWNNTTSGTADTGKYGEAGTEYDRIYLDFALAYNYKGIRLDTYEGDDITVGVKIFAVKDGVAKELKDAQFKLSDLDNKNRLEYYYGINNVNTNFKNYTYYAVPYLYVNGSAPAEMNITDSGTVKISDIAAKGLSGDNKVTYPTIDNVVYD